MPAITVLSMGWGVQTWTLAAMMALDEMPRADYLVFADTTHEGRQTYEFIQQWTPWLAEHGLVTATVRAPRVEVVEGSAVMIPAFTVDAQTGKAGQVRRECTHDWKIMPIRRFIRAELTRGGLKPTPGVVECWMGISYDEWQRMRDSDVAYIKNVYPLVERRMTRAGCIAWLETYALPTPPKSACVFCPYQSRSRWAAMKRAGGSDWAHAVAVDESVRDRRPTHGPLFVHSARVPLDQAVSIPEDQGASQPMLDGFEEVCDGGHCGA